MSDPRRRDGFVHPGDLVGLGTRGPGTLSRYGDRSVGDAPRGEGREEQELNAAHYKVDLLRSLLQAYNPDDPLTDRSLLRKLQDSLIPAIDDLVRKQDLQQARLMEKINRIQISRSRAASVDGNRTRQRSVSPSPPFRGRARSYSSPPHNRRDIISPDSDEGFNTPQHHPPNGDANPILAPSLHLQYDDGSSEEDTSSTLTDQNQQTSPPAGIIHNQAERKDKGKLASQIQHAPRTHTMPHRAASSPPGRERNQVHYLRTRSVSPQRSPPR